MSKILNEGLSHAEDTESDMNYTLEYVDNTSYSVS